MKNRISVFTVPTQGTSNFNSDYNDGWDDAQEGDGLRVNYNHQDWWQSYFAGYVDFLDKGYLKQ